MGLRISLTTLCVGSSPRILDVGLRDPSVLLDVGG